MTKPQPEGLLALIEAAEAATTTATQASQNPLARAHLEIALALIREAWIAEDGQEARPAFEVIAEVQEAENLFALAFRLKEEGGAK